MSRRRKMILVLVGVVVVGFIILQLIPANIIAEDFARTNPEAHSQIEWNSATTEQMMHSACYDCHSNETVWPWYSQVAPISWLVAKDVNEGREALNLSEQTANQIDPEELIEEVEEGAMPPPAYLMLHPNAKLVDEQEQILFDGLLASLHGTENEGSENAGRESEESQDDED